MNNFDRGSNSHIVAEWRKENASLKTEIKELKNEVNRLERENSELLAEVKSWTVGNH